MHERLRIAVIDDEPDLAELLALAATSMGHRALATSCPDRVMRACVEGVDLVVLDLSMPRMSGVELLEIIARSDAPPRVILMSGLDEGVRDATRRFATNLGLTVHATLAKPFGIAEFVEALGATKRGVQPLPVRARAERLGVRDVERALNEDRIEVVLQPQVSLQDLRIVGVEALVRLRDTGRRLVAPESFLPAARAGSLMDALTVRVLTKALVVARTLTVFAPAVGVSVNVPARTLASRGFSDEVVELLERNGVSSERLTLEVTEDELTLRDVPTLRSFLALRLTGVRFSIDDFGTGHSTLAQAHGLPVSELKIDKGFVSSVRDSPRAEAIVRSVVRLGHELGMRVVAEGVENEETAARVRALGCTHAQGFLYGRPMSLEELVSRLVASQSLRASA